MGWWTVRLDQLMEVSEREVSLLAERGSEHDQRAVTRILDDANSYRLWLTHHERQMRQAASLDTYNRQLLALREVAMAQIHGKAVIEFLRDYRVRGRERELLIQVFYGPRNYAEAVVREHAQYVRSSASYACTKAVGRSLMLDAVFDHWIPDYERVYKDYFAAFAMTRLEEARGTGEHWGDAVLPVMKQELATQRRRILALPRVPERSSQGHELRLPSGDTVAQPISARLRELLRLSG